MRLHVNFRPRIKICLLSIWKKHVQVIRVIQIKVQTTYMQKFDFDDRYRFPESVIGVSTCQQYILVRLIRPNAVTIRLMNWYRKTTLNEWRHFSL